MVGRFSNRCFDSRLAVQAAENKNKIRLLKRSALCLVSFFLSYHAYAEPDSIRVVSRDTTSKDSIQILLRLNPPLKSVLTKKKSVYTLKPAVDIPIVVAGTTWSLYALTKIYHKTPPTVEQIQGLKTSDINAFDRWAVYPYSKSLDRVSYYPFYAAIPLPLIFFLSDRETRGDFFKLTFLYWETMSAIGLLGMTATYNVDRYRPYAYSPGTSMDKRTGSIAINSFYAGHVQVVAAPTFFIAKVYADYHPDSKIKWVFYGVATVATGATSYMRLRGGMHFPSDVLLGTATGVLAGILVPHYHKTKSSTGSSMSVLPYSSGDQNGLVFTYHFKR
jgi:membrane-associated phospholipid phosphatase